MSTSQCSTHFTSTSFSSQPSSSQGEATQHLESIRKNAISLFNSINHRKGINESYKKTIKDELTNIRRIAASDIQLVTALKACEVSITILRGDLLSKIWTPKNRELLDVMYLHSIQATPLQAEESRFESKKRPRSPEPYSQHVELNKLPRASDVATPISTTSTRSTHRPGEAMLRLIHEQARFLYESIKSKPKRSPMDEERKNNTAHWLTQIIKESLISSDLAQFVCRCETHIFFLSVSLKNEGLWNPEEKRAVMNIISVLDKK